MIPQAELDDFVLSFSEALALGAENRLVRGYRLLRGGIDRVCASDFPYRDELVDLWQRGLTEFKQRFPTEWYPED